MLMPNPEYDQNQHNTQKLDTHVNTLTFSPHLGEQMEHCSNASSPALLAMELLMQHVYLLQCFVCHVYLVTRCQV